MLGYTRNYVKVESAVFFWLPEIVIFTRMHVTKKEENVRMPKVCECRSVREHRRERDERSSAAAEVPLIMSVLRVESE
jgi:hypothetical protein